MPKFSTPGSRNGGSPDGGSHGGRSYGGWPAVAALVAVIAIVLFFTLSRNDRAAKLRVGSGTAQAMWDGTHTGDAPRRE